MLPAASRLTSGDEFRAAIRTGRRAGSSTMVVHLADDPNATAPRAGFVVSRAVGNAVTRNRVRRRLRHLVRADLPTLPRSAVLVVRALPAAARTPSADLASDLRSCLRRVAA